jgi:hypothetical protein
LRRVDPRFCLPQSPRTAIVLDERSGWREGLVRAGIEVAAAGDGADLVVAPAARAREALAIGAPHVLLEGHGGARALRRAGLATQTLLVRPTAARPDFILPRASNAGIYAVHQWAAAGSGVKLLRNRAATLLMRLHAMPEIEPVIAIGARTPGLPYVVAAARGLGVPPDAGWFLTLGQGDDLSRNAFQLFRPGASTPDWVLKFARLPGYSEPFERDERGLALAAAAGPLVARRASQLVGRFQVDGLEASLETAAPGKKLRAALLAPGSQTRKLELVEAVAAWVLELGSTTAGPADALAEERERLATDVVPAWHGRGVSSDLVSDLPAVAPVLQHNDLGTWNIVVDGTDFVVVDWESARRCGLPLWDLLYFLTDALTTLTASESPDDQDRVARELLRGEAPHSALLFQWVDRATATFELPRSAVGRIATLGWLHHGLSHGARTAAVRSVTEAEAGAPGPIGRIADFWLDDPALGLDWTAWRDR